MIRSIPAGGQAAVSKPRASGDDPHGLGQFQLDPG